MFQFSQASKDRLATVDPRLQLVAHRALQISKIDFGIPPYGGKRTEQEQFFLYSSGKSKADGIHNRSKHQDGKALDVYAYVDGKASWDRLHLAVVAAAMLQAATELGVKLRWGGLFKSWGDFPEGDYPHLELAD